MSSPDEPRWDLLPGDPEGFFGLEPESYDRKTLKRRYTALLKRFKPEKFPEEFQKLRAAYEALDSELRYGASREERTDPIYDWSSSEDADAATARERSTSSSDRDGVSTDKTSRAPSYSAGEIIKALGTKDTTEVHSEIAALATKSPFHHFALALLADANTKEGSTALIEHLVVGLQDYPDEPGLYGLLWHVLYDLPIDKSVSSLLKRLASTLDSASFFHVTESLWLRLVKRIPFDKFRAILEACEDRLREGHPGARLVFYLRVVHVSMFRAPLPWLDEKLRLLDENARSIGYGFEEEVDLLQLLVSYRRKRPDFVGKASHPIRRHIDAAIRAYCELPEVESDRVFLETQMAIIESEMDVLEAFPLCDEGYGYALAPFYYLARDVESRVDVVDREPETGELSRRTRDFLNRVEKLTDRSNSGSLFTIFGVFYYVVTYGLLIVPPVLVSFALVDDFSWAAFGPAVAIWGPLYWLFIKKKLVDHTHFRIVEKISRRCYGKIWRKEVFHFLKATRYHCDDLQATLEAFSDPEITNDDWIAAYMSMDFGISFYSLAQRFLH